jgi:hypothetical protein
VTVLDPVSAPPRPDLTWLRHRRRPPATAAPVDYHHHDSHAAGHSAALPAPEPVAPVSSSLDLSAPEPAPTASTKANDRSPLLEPPAPALRRVPARRATTGLPLVLTGSDPVVTLTRLQSGIGALTLEAACSDAVGDLSLACAYRLRSGVSSVAVNRDGLALAPAHSTTPVLRVHRERFDTITVDCRRVLDLDRLLVIGYSPSGAELDWGGTLILTTFGRARVETAMDGPSAAGAVGLVTIYQVGGELVVRAERREVVSNVREACLAFGFDRITWLDPNTPAT